MARPREFDPETALEAIKAAFWTEGYEGTSMHKIEAATGLKKQSLYRVFGDKRAMYLAALRDYEKDELASAVKALRAPGSVRARFDRILTQAADDALAKGDRRGCFLCNAGADQALLDTDSRQQVQQMMARVEEAFAAALNTDPAFAADPARAASMTAELMAGYFGLRILVASHVPDNVVMQAKTALLDKLPD